MPQPKSTSKRARAAAAVDPTGLLEILARGVVLTADRIQEAMDDAVQRGRMTRGDAEDLARLLIEAGRKQTEELLHDVEALVGRPLAAAGDRARRVTGLGGFPIGGYDDLTAAQITSRLGELSDGELRQVRDYERRHGNRKSVLRALERRLA
ncbi:MAG TPA: hypothetical protein VFR97_01960 [Capillimicrobium sp.]|nr:hypothetical protein [Capillimicrobium sp.]